MKHLGHFSYCEETYTEQQIHTREITKYLQTQHTKLSPSHNNIIIMRKGFCSIHSKHKTRKGGLT